MKRSILSMAMVAACLLGGSVQVTGCSSGSGSEQPSAAGTLRMPLVTQVNGHTYRLLADLSIYGPSYTYLSTGDDPTATVLTTTLPTGDYSAYLNYWSLEMLSASGTFEPVSATLVSDYYVSFSIYNLSSTTISFQFQTDGTMVPFGEGQLNVKFGVNEIPPACAVLGNDCPSGMWCPPPGLTGRGLSCTYAGTAPLGTGCDVPTDCVANSTCMDLGSGPVCASLCLPEQIGSTCADGGVCTSASPDYGVCVPPGGSLPSGTGGSTSTDAGVAGFPSVGGRTWIATGGKPSY